MDNITKFEMLPDEMILYICKYLRCGEILYSFFNLNSRLNSTIADYCRHVNLKDVTYKQFSFVARQIIPSIALSIRSFVYNAQWQNIIPNELDSNIFKIKLSLIFPHLQKLSLLNFSDTQLKIFLNNLVDLLHLVKLEIQNLQGKHTHELLEKILAANNHRLKSIIFDYDSTFLMVATTRNDENTFYRNIEELKINLKTDKMLEPLFTFLPCIKRLHIDFDYLSNDSKSTLINSSSLLHLKDFQLRSIGPEWSLNEIAFLLNKMPSLTRLSLDLCTSDANFVNGQSFIEILPSILLEIHLFIIYNFSDVQIEIDTLISSWPTNIPVKCLLDQENQYLVLHTVPCDFHAMIMPSNIANQMLTGSEYTRKVKELKLFGEQNSIDIYLIVQHFHRLRKLIIDIEKSPNTLTTQPSQQFTLYLPQLTSLSVYGIYEISRIVRVAPKLKHLRIDLNCFIVILQDKSTCEILKNQIVELDIMNFQEDQLNYLDTIAETFTHLQDLSLCLESSTASIDVLILKVLLLWKDNKNLRTLYIRGELNDEIKNDLRQWIINHSYFTQEDVFVVEYKTNWISMWLR